MFRCQSCGKSVPPGIKVVDVVINRRKRNYQSREAANRMATWKEDRQDRINSTKDNGGAGWEIGKLQKVCPSCAKSYQIVEDISSGK